MVFDSIQQERFSRHFCVPLCVAVTVRNSLTKSVWFAHRGPRTLEPLKMLRRTLHVTVQSDKFLQIIRCTIVVLKRTNCSNKIRFP